VKQLVERALAFHTLSIADLVAIFEDTRPEARVRRVEALRLLSARTRGFVVGLTGAPGSGKSTLLGRLALALHDEHELAVAVVAVDPSSTVSGGALLGDRVRVRFPPDDPHLYFRSQASDTELGGLGPGTFQACRLLQQIFDVVIVETVGVGQSEADVRMLADRLYLVLDPHGGDEVQLLKAGVLEVPDAVVVNKCDLDAAPFVASLRMTLPLSRPFDLEMPIFPTSATRGDGVAALASDLADQAKRPRERTSAKEARFFRRWVRREWGRAGERILDAKLGGDAFITSSGGFDEAEAAFDAALRRAL
jgi:LAO/AO transport system kinase